VNVIFKQDAQANLDGHQLFQKDDTYAFAT
jgi:hypothetical protein